MKFIEIDKSIKNKEWNMTDLHEHAHYEIYFLFEGSRSFFLNNALYKIFAPCLVVISPYVMHKTEGFGFSRINVNVSKESLDPYEISVLKRIADKPVSLSKEHMSILSPLLEKAFNIYKTDDKFSVYKLSGILSYIILYIDGINLQENVTSIQTDNKNVSPIALKILDYVSNNYSKKISLEILSKNFYISKVTLCAYFKAAMNCTIGEYVMKLRLNKAKQLLSSTKKSVEEISDLCGFSSGAYMGLIFKEKIGLSPLQYRKMQNTKE